MRIDVHAHYWPGTYMQALIDSGRRDLEMFAKQPDDFDTRLATMDRNGVQLQILSAVGLNVELPGAADAARVTSLLNDTVHEVTHRYPGRFAAFVSVPLPHVQEAIAETERGYAELGAVGVGLPCIVGGRPIDHPDFEPFWENLARHDAVVYIHPAGTESAVHPGLDQWGLGIGFGSPLQISVAPIRVMYSGLAARYPSLRFVFAMCAGFMPYLYPRIERNLRRGYEQTAVVAAGKGFMSYLKDMPMDPADPLATLRTFWYDIAIQDVDAALLCARDSYGADRLLLGSDEIFASLDDAVQFIERSEYLSAEQKTAILDVNAEQMFGDTIAHLVAASAATAS